MTDQPSSKCPECGAPLAKGQSDSLCPACMMLQAMETTQAPPTQLMELGQSLALNGPSEFPCDFGDYQLVSLLGRGGMGTVYEATQRSTGRRVALKMLGQQIESVEMRQRFLREGRLAAGISHPNSLYVYGAEEIDGIPVITMEIAASGTLTDELKKRGPLPIADAVDAALGIIAGLESAESVGVLHRDIKPSNIFVSPDGSVKVGDYGLSVSTVASMDSFATATGVALGTPAYAAPEQLRGHETDVRADTYSLGATLYTLLTHRPPIEGKNPVNIVAAALDEKPKRITELRPDAPEGLARVLAKCLEKSPGQRFANYAALRDALIPYSSDTPQPASVPKRTLAGFVDALFAWLLPAVAVTSYHGRLNITEMFGYGEYLPLLALAIWHVLYFGIPEGIWGAGLGKWLIGIRVAKSDGHAPGLRLALARASLHWFSGQGATLALLFVTLVGSGPPSTYIGASFFYVGAQISFLLVPFLFMRRSNGWAALWDRFTDTRVIARLSGLSRPRIDTGVEEILPDEKAERMGPYIVGERVTEDWVIGLDPTLRRSVWLRRGSSMDGKRRDVARPGRLRWQESIDVGEDQWDVLEAPRGIALNHLLQRDTAPHWGSMRYWLYDLVVEIAQAAQDGTLPPSLGLDQVWISESGRAILLDEPVAGTMGSQARFDVSDNRGRMRFLDTVASTADPTSVPLHARALLMNLMGGTFEKLSFIAGNLRSLLRKPDRIEGSSRAASLLIVPLFLLAYSMLVMVLAWPAATRARTAALTEMYPDLPALNEVLRFHYSIPKAERRFIYVHLAGHYDLEKFSNYADWDHYRLLTDYEKELLKKFTVPRPIYTPEELAASDLKVADLLPTFLENERRVDFARYFNLALDLSVRAMGVIALVQLVCLLVFQTSLGLVLFGIGMVDREGQPLGRDRLVVRWLIGWSMFGVSALIIAKIPPMALVLFFPWVIGIGFAISDPTRGLHDRLSGTCLVAR